MFCFFLFGAKNEPPMKFRIGIEQTWRKTRAILLFHIISSSSSEQPLVVGSTLGVYSVGLIFVSATTTKRHHHHHHQANSSVTPRSGPTWSLDLFPKRVPINNTHLWSVVYFSPFRSPAPRSACAEFLAAQADYTWPSIVATWVGLRSKMFLFNSKLG